MQEHSSLLLHEQELPFIALLIKYTVFSIMRQLAFWTYFHADNKKLYLVNNV